MRDWVMFTAIKAYEFMLPFYWLVLAIALLVLLPLAFWRKTSNFAGVGLIVSSYIFGVTTWLFSAAITFGSFGWLGLILGLFFLGIGVVPLAMIAAVFKLGNWGLLIVLLVMVAVTLGVRFAGLYAPSRNET